MNRILSAALFCCFAGSVCAADGDKPNVLLIITDEHNFRTLGCYRELLPREQAESEFTRGALLLEGLEFCRVGKERQRCRPTASSPSKSVTILGPTAQHFPAARIDQQRGEERSWQEDGGRKMGAGRWGQEDYRRTFSCPHLPAKSFAQSLVSQKESAADYQTLCKLIHPQRTVMALFNSLS